MNTISQQNFISSALSHISGPSILVETRDNREIIIDRILPETGPVRGNTTVIVLALCFEGVSVHPSNP